MARAVTGRYEQLALKVGRRSLPTFDNYLGEHHAEVVARLKGLQPGDRVWLHGGRASGRSHLLQAVAARRPDAAYLALRLVAPGRTGGALEALVEQSPPPATVLVDDVDALAGDGEAEHLLFRLCNDLRERGAVTVVSAALPPLQAGFALADLASRFAAFECYRLPPPDDEARLALLRGLARRRGLQLSGTTARFLLDRHARDLQSLVELVERLDDAAWRTQRRLTIPFVRAVLDGTA